MVNVLVAGSSVRSGRQEDRMVKGIGVAALLVCAAYASVASAEPAQGVTPRLLSLGTYDAFHVQSERGQPFVFKATAAPAVDLVVREHTYAAGSTTGWHTHPGPVFITVIEGTLTVYEWGDPTCTPTHIDADPNTPYPNAYVDSGHGHVARNESGAPAVDMTVIVAPVGASFRSDLPADQSPCGF
jgi:hypothetical protein